MSISGYLKGSATLFLPDGKQLPMSGKVHLTHRDEWYSNDFQIKYSPDDVQSGHLKIRYILRGDN